MLASLWYMYVPFYAGMLAAWFRMLYPSIVVGYVVCTICDWSVLEFLVFPTYRNFDLNFVFVHLHTCISAINEDTPGHRDVCSLIMCTSCRCPTSHPTCTHHQHVFHVGHHVCGSTRNRLSIIFREWLHGAEEILNSKLQYCTEVLLSTSISSSLPYTSAVTKIGFASSLFVINTV